MGVYIPFSCWIFLYCFVNVGETPHSLPKGQSAQDLAEVLPLNFSQRGCLGLCGQGPNCLLETKKGSQALNHLDSFSKVISMVKKFLKAQGAVLKEMAS